MSEKKIMKIWKLQFWLQNELNDFEKQLKIIIILCKKGETITDSNKIYRYF